MLPFRAALAVVTLALSVHVGTWSIAAAPQATRVSGFDVTQAWMRVVRSHTVGVIDDAARQAAYSSPLAQSQIIADLQLVRLLVLQAGRTGLVQNLSSSSSTTPSPRPVFAELRGRRLTLEQLAPLLGLTPEETGGPLTAVAIADADSPARSAIAKVMTRAAMLHTDIAMARPQELPAAPASGPRFAQTAVLLNDGRATSVLSVAIHYAIAREAIALVMPATAGSAIGRRWYLATLAYLQGARDYSSLLPHLETARISLAADARIWLWSGAAYENLAAPVFQVAAGVTAAKIESPSLMFARAEQFYHRALELDAACAECSLRLARVRQLSGHAEEAATLLARAEPKLGTPMLRYFAALFAGRSAEMLDRIPEARAAYVRAMALFPQAQSPRLALADLSFRDSEQTQALSGVRTMFVTAASSVDGDPWWYYDVSLAANWAELVADMRKTAASLLEGR